MYFQIAFLKKPSTSLVWFTLVLCLLLLSIITVFNPMDVHALITPEIESPRALLMDFETGTVLYEKNAREVTFPASTTKVMTALLVLEQASLDEVVFIEEEPGVSGSSMYILPGESFTVETLLEALLIRSANDAAKVLAIHLSGTEEAFAESMNLRAAALGAVNTNFTNPHGLPDEAHVTTAYDLALIAREAMKHDVFREIVARHNLIIPATHETDQRIYNNSNRFLWGKGPSHQMIYQGSSTDIFYEPVDGIKTGYTNSARNCLISSAQYNDHRFIAVVLNAEQEHIYVDSRTLLDYGFQHFHHVTVAESGTYAGSLRVNNGTSESLDLFIDRNLTYIFPRSILRENISHTITYLNEELTAPIEADTVQGWIDYYHEDEFLGQVMLMNQEAVEYVTLHQRISPFTYGSLIAAGLFSGWKLFVLQRRKKRRRRRQRTSDRYRQYESI